MAKKGKYDDLDPDFKQAAEAMGEGEIHETITKVNLSYEALMEVKDADEDLKLKKAVAKEAGAIYREGTKFRKLATSYLREMLKAKGKPSGEAATE